MTALYQPNQSRIDHALATAAKQSVVVTQGAIFVKNALLFGGNPSQGFSGTAYVIPQKGDLADSGYSLNGQVIVSMDVAWQIANMTKLILEGQSDSIGIKAQPSKHIKKINMASLLDFNTEADKTYRYLNIKGAPAAQMYQQGQSERLSSLYEPDLAGLVSFRIKRNLASYQDGRMLTTISPETIDPDRRGLHMYWDFKDGAKPRQHIFGRFGDFKALAAMGENILTIPPQFDEGDIGQFAVADVLIYPFAVQTPQNKVFVQHDIRFIVIKDRPFPSTGFGGVDSGALLTESGYGDMADGAPIVFDSAPAAPAMPQAPAAPVAPAAPAMPQAPAAPVAPAAPAMPQAPAALVAPAAPAMPQAPAAPVAPAAPAMPQAPAAPVAPAAPAMPQAPQAPVAPAAPGIETAQAFLSGLGG